MSILLLQLQMPGDNDVNNYIHDNEYGVYNESTSGPELGLYKDKGVIYGGFNFLELNTNYDVYNTSAVAEIYAQVNWWGKFPIVTPDIDVEYPAEVVMGSGPGALPKHTSTSDEITELYAQGISLELDSLYADAILTFDSVITQAPQDEIFLKALAGIQRCYSSTTIENGLLNHLNSYVITYPESFVGFLSLYFYAGELAKQGDLEGAVVKYEECLTIFQNLEEADEEEAWTLFNIAQVYEALAELEEGLGKRTELLAKVAAIYETILLDYPSSEASMVIRELLNLPEREIVRIVVPTEFKLNSPYPNPFNPSVTIPYDLAETSDFSVVIYDILGREVWSHKQVGQMAGNYSIVWNGMNQAGQLAASGLYLIRFTSPEYTGTQKALLLR